MLPIDFDYPAEIYNSQNPQVILPIVRQYIEPNSVLDVGCGLGFWLKEFVEAGIKDYLGIDGDYVLKQPLQIDKAHFLAVDLVKGFQLGRKFDLAICLEVAEHLPEDAARNLVSCLCQHADVILFSAAIPLQGGNGHLNEQWPNYWQKLFQSFDYAFFDLIRPKIWNNPKVYYVYRQNVFLAAKKESKIALQYKPPEYVDVVHPEMYLFHAKQSIRCQLIEEGYVGWQIPLKALWKTSLNKISGKNKLEL